jgi:hypothetical protein
MRRFFLSFSLIFLLAISACVNSVFAQESNKEYFPTPNTQIGATPDPKKQKEKEKRIRFIITNDTKNTLPGNRCFEEVTTGMGFQYLAIPKGQALNKNGFSRWGHNFGVKFMILLKNGPFWKTKVNKKFDECKYGSGDFIG